MTDFLPTVTEAFRSLLDRGLLGFESSSYNPHAFGNSIVTLSGRNVRVRLIRDRDEVFADAASSQYPDSWIPLQRILNVLRVSSPLAEGLLTPEQAAQLVEQHFGELDKGLQGSEIEHTKLLLDDAERLAMTRRNASGVQDGT